MGPAAAENAASGGNLLDWLQATASDPLTLFILLFGATLIWEDAAALAGAILAAQGLAPFEAAFGGVAAGIIVGDLGLYLIGYAARRNRRIYGWVTQRKLGAAILRQSGSWVRRHMIKVIVFARMFPGLRVPTYAVCGFADAGFWRFAAVAVFAVLAWIALIFYLAMHFQAFLENTLDMQSSWLMLLAGFVVLMIGLRQIAKRVFQDLAGGLGAAAEGDARETQP